MAELKIPNHIAFIMDGNGRWAKRRLLPRKIGHREGVKAMERVIDASNEFGIKALSFYAFSTENWSRPKEEIDALFELVLKFASKELPRYVNKNFRLRFMGDIDNLPPNVRQAIDKLTDSSASNSGMIINIGLNYGGQDEIVRAVNKLISAGEVVSISSIDNALDTQGIMNPDIIARSANERRLSNFMLWQASYSELIFKEQLWPDFDAATVKEIIDEYSSRLRKFGKVIDNG